MKICSFSILLIFPVLLFGQSVIEPCKSGQPLIDALQEFYQPDSTLGYGPARDTLYSKIDNNELELSGIYTDFTVALEPGKDPSISVFQNERGLNAEHVYPQSKGARDEPGRSDMHNLYPSKVNVNAARGSCIFGEVEDTDTEFWFILGERLTQIPSENIDGYSEKDEESCVFEPREIVKGDIARAVFYFYAIYQNKAEQADANFFPRQKNTLLQWHRADPVSDQEVRRSTLIASYQGNPNPFVVDTSLAERAFFQMDADYGSGSPNCITTNVVETRQPNWIQLQSNLVEQEISLRSTERNIQLQLVDINGRVVRRAQFDFEQRLDVSNLPRGPYFLLVQNQAQRQVFKVIKF